MVFRYHTPMPQIHPTASVSADADIAPDAIVGPFCQLNGPVRLGAGVRLISNVIIQGPCTIGDRTVVYPFACLGFEPQDYKFRPGTPTAGVRIGAECLIREYATIHAATKQDRPTTLGDRCFLMVASHVGHDARVGNSVVLVNNVCLAGHSEVEDQVTISGGSVVHQFCRIGRLAFISGGSALSTDLPPYCVAWGRNSMVGLNLVGMRRSGVSRDQITDLRTLFRKVFMARLTRPEMIEALDAAAGTCPPAGEIAAFLRTSKRALCPYRTPAERQDDVPAALV
jgi:UDP-N-acetylglucosamine acyltransferase